eukprot:CAMPEP_0170605522 /NCGR_PEP_ID=MMETSP0224-20130122/20017_1 /TAXON_ID=285029 /ORGANISM="Togula jolla, Strain CCCM 725" /LENGTH=295 /DNA_ID=CAMNT_0010930529 /DNA_START=120 /DNA_END=1007 /DNA_ORIENTATION=+
MMDAMMGGMMMPFGGRRGGGPFGSDPFGGDPFGGFMGGGLFGGMDQMMSMGGKGGGGGSFSCQTMMFSSQVGQDGKVHTERFASSTVGDQSRSIRETQQAYSNSSSGVDKMSLERRMGEQGRKVVKERFRHSGDERQTEMLRGVSEDKVHEFDDRWQEEAAPWLPSRKGMSQRLTYDGPGQGATSSAAHSGARRGDQPAAPRALTNAPAANQRDCPAVGPALASTPAARQRDRPAAGPPLASAPAARQGDRSASAWASAPGGPQRRQVSGQSGYGVYGSHPYGMQSSVAGYPRQY